MKAIIVYDSYGDYRAILGYDTKRLNGNPGDILYECYIEARDESDDEADVFDREERVLSLAMKKGFVALTPAEDDATFEIPEDI